jgi:hypothetical protein
MIDFTIETRIDRAPGAVFGYVTDPAKLATWQTNTVAAEKLGDELLGLGSRLREVHRAPGGKELESLLEVSEYEPGRVFALRVLEGTPVHLRITFAPDGACTVMRFTAHGRLNGPLRLLQPLLGRTLERQFKRQCATLKQVLESAAPAHC